MSKAKKQEIKRLRAALEHIAYIGPAGVSCAITHPDEPWCWCAHCVAAGALTSTASIPEQQLEEMKRQTLELEKLNGETKSKPPVIDNRR